MSAVKDAASKAGDTAKGAKDTATDGAGSLKDQTVGAFSQAARDIIGPAG